MSTWRVRHEGSPKFVEFPSPIRILEGLRDGDWEASDEVRGPNDNRWVPLEEHPLFEDPVAELAPPPPPEELEAHLDMNPLIDVALVLLIFFMLTATVSSLRRAIELPPEPPEDKGKTTTIKMDDIKDRAFKVKIRMEDDKPVIKLEDKPIQVGDIEKEILDFVKTTGKKELFADITPDVPWGIEAKLYDAAKGADIIQIYWPKGR